MVKQIISKGTSMSNAAVKSPCKAFWAVMAIMFAPALHPARANAQGGGAPTDPQIVGMVGTLIAHAYNVRCRFAR